MQLSTASGSLDQLISRGDIWHARQTGESTCHFDLIASGHPSLDNQLQGGWQLGNLVEILYPEEGSGELRLLLPLLAALPNDGRWIAWVDPPHTPYAPALASAGIDIKQCLMIHSKNNQDRLWALEQTLKSNHCSVVLGWLAARQEKAIRRLQVAAASTRTLVFLFRPYSCLQESSSAPYRLSLKAQQQGVDVKLVKRKNGWAMPTQHLTLTEQNMHLKIPAITPKT